MYSTTAELLSLCQLLSGRPATDADMTAAKWYALLTLGQQHWTNVLATHYPEAAYGAPVQLVSDDSGATYRLPLVDDAEVFPMGLFELRARRNGPVLTVGAEFDDVDFTLEGTKLRVPHGKTRTFSDGPWIRYAAPPGAIDEDTEPTLKPVQARPLIAYHALWLWASRPPQPADPGFFAAMEQKAWSGDPEIPGDYGLEGALATQYLPAQPVELGDAWWRNAGFR